MTITALALSCSAFYIALDENIDSMHIKFSSNVEPRRIRNTIDSRMGTQHYLQWEWLTKQEM